jgi:hypothetical protein
MIGMQISDMRTEFPAVAPVIEVDAVFAVATTLRLSHARSYYLAPTTAPHVKPQKFEQAPDLQYLGGAEGI